MLGSEYHCNELDTFNAKGKGKCAEEIVLETFNEELVKRNCCLEGTSKKKDIMGIDAYLITPTQPPVPIGITSTWNTPGMDKDLIRVAIGNSSNTKKKNIFNMPVNRNIHYTNLQKKIFVFQMVCFRKFVIEKLPDIKKIQGISQLINEKPELFTKCMKLSVGKIYLRKTNDSFDLIYYANLNEIDEYFTKNKCKIITRCSSKDVIKKCKEKYGIKE